MHVSTSYELHPDRLSAIVNYALYMHTLEKDYDQASEVYKRGAQIAKRHPVLLYVLVPWCHGLPRLPHLGAASRCMPTPPPLQLRVWDILAQPEQVPTQAARS